MNTYFSTFITGFKEVITTALTAKPGVEIDYCTDGLVIYKSAFPLKRIEKLAFLNNSFILIKKKTVCISPDAPNIMLSLLLSDTAVSKLIRKHFSDKKRTFRIRGTIANQHVRMDKRLVRKLEKKICQSAPNLAIDRSLPDIEFTISIRTEGIGLSGIQFTRRPNYEKTLAKGEIYPELAYILCLISTPKRQDVFLDPMAGYGAIPAQRMTFPYKHILAGDSDLKKVTHLRKKITGKQIDILQLNVRNLEEIESDSIDKIVTDPPWGIYQSIEIDLRKFYKSMLSEFVRVIRPDGLIVILTAQKELLETLIDKNHRVILSAKYDTLVSGKKAGVYKINVVK